MYACGYSPPCKILAQRILKESLGPSSTAFEKQRQHGGAAEIPGLFGALAVHTDIELMKLTFQSGMGWKAHKRQVRG